MPVAIAAVVLATASLVNAAVANEALVPAALTNGAAAGGVAMPGGGTPHGAVRGLDVSSFQHRHGKTIRWRLLARAGFRFAGIKAAEGDYYVNPYYAKDASAARAAGLKVMPYVFANPRRAGGAATAAYAIGTASYHRGGGTLPLAVDLEKDPYSVKNRPGACYGLRGRRMVAWIAGFVSKATALAGIRPVIYTNAGWWRRCTGNTGRFRRYPLWIADYGVQAPAALSSWPRWTFWQYSDAMRIPGAGAVDADFYRGGHHEHRRSHHG